MRCAAALRSVVVATLLTLAGVPLACAGRPARAGDDAGPAAGGRGGAASKPAARAAKTPRDVQLAVPEMPWNGVVASVCFSPDGKTFAAASHDSLATGVDAAVWNLATGKEIARASRTNINHRVNQIAFSSDGKTLLLARNGGNLHLLPVVKAGKGVEVPAHGRHCMALGLSPSRKVTASGGYDGTVRTWSPQGKPLQEFRVAKAYRPDGMAAQSLAVLDDRFIASGHHDHMVRIWDLNTGKLARELPHPNPVSIVHLSGDGELFVTACADRKIRVWKRADYAAVRTLDQFGNGLAGLAALPGSTRFLGIQGGDWFVFDAASGAVTTTGKHPAPDRFWTAVAVHPQGDLAALGDTKGAVHWFSVSADQGLEPIPTPPAGRD